MATATQNIGHITQVIGSTFDVEFDEDKLPAIYNAVTIESEKKGVKVDLTWGEVQQQLGGGRVRCVALGSTDGLTRGKSASTPEHLSRCRWARRRSVACSTFWADPSTGVARSPPDERWPIHREAPRA